MDAAFIIIHEVSHAASNVLDKQYSWYICQQLAVYNPAEAVNNAQSYALFAMGQLDVPKLNPLDKLNLKTGTRLPWKRTM